MYLCPVLKLFCCGHVHGCQTHMSALHIPVCVWHTLSCCHKHTESCELSLNMFLFHSMIHFYANLAISWLTPVRGVNKAVWPFQSLFILNKAFWFSCSTLLGRQGPRCRQVLSDCSTALWITIFSYRHFSWKIGHLIATRSLKFFFEVSLSFFVSLQLRLDYSVWPVFFNLAKHKLLAIDTERRGKDRKKEKLHIKVTGAQTKLLDTWRISSMMKHSFLHTTFRCFSNTNTDSHNKPTIVNQGSQAIFSLLNCKVQHSCLHSTLWETQMARTHWKGSIFMVFTWLVLEQTAFFIKQQTEQHRNLQIVSDSCKRTDALSYCTSAIIKVVRKLQNKPQPWRISFCTSNWRELTKASLCEAQKAVKFEKQSYVLCVSEQLLRKSSSFKVRFCTENQKKSCNLHSERQLCEKIILWENILHIASWGGSIN